MKKKKMVMIWVTMVSIILQTISFAIPCSFAEGVEMPTASVNLDVTAPSYILTDTNGEIFLEKDSHAKRPIASVTKIMTMLLAMEAVKGGKITMDTQISASEYATSMGGSQIFLAPNEKMSLHDMLKAIAVVSANDAAVAVGEAIMGSNGAFVSAMNQRAKALGMKDTNFVNCNGLDDPNHYSSAYDVAIMSRELLKYPEIRPFLTIWMDSIRDGKFALSNTNKMIRFYEGSTGIKTGSTSKAKFCLSTSAKRDGLELITVVLGAENSKDRFADATKLLNYGFANYTQVNMGKKGDKTGVISVKKGVADSVEAMMSQDINLTVAKDIKGKITSKVDVASELYAPIKAGDKIGTVSYMYKDKTLGSSDLVACSDVERVTFFNVFGNLMRKLMLR